MDYPWAIQMERELDSTKVRLMAILKASLTEPSRARHLLFSMASMMVHPMGTSKASLMVAWMACTMELSTDRY